MNLSLEQRTKILDKVCRLVETKHFNPAMNGDQALQSGDEWSGLEGAR